MAALQLGRDLDVSYKTAYVLSHKLREALSAENATGVAKGEVEIDGCYFGGHVKPAFSPDETRPGSGELGAAHTALHVAGIPGRSISADAIAR